MLSRGGQLWYIGKASVRQGGFDMDHRHVNRCVILLILVCIIAMQPLGATPSDVNCFDRVLMFPYSYPLSTISDVTQYIAFFSPALLALAEEPPQWLGLSLLYGTTAVFSFGTRTLMKATIDRARPYTYFPGSPQQSPAGEDDHSQSFPSGHSIMAFTGAAFTHTMFALRYPDSPLRMPITISAWTFAAATAVLRVASGNHFASDVLAGAAIGSLFGIAVPMLAHRIIPSWNDRVRFALGPQSVMVAISY